MQKPEDFGLTFLVIVPNYWCKNTSLPEAKKVCRREGNWAPKQKRIFRTFLVHEDSYINELGNIVYPNQTAADSAIDLGEL